MVPKTLVCLVLTYFGLLVGFVALVFLLVHFFFGLFCFFVLFFVYFCCFCVFWFFGLTTTLSVLLLSLPDSSGHENHYNM